MTAGGGHDRELSASEIDRLRELTSIGAGHAAGAFAQLAGRTIRMEVPRVRYTGKASGEWSSGVLFDVEGPPSGVMGILFHRASHRDVARRLLGPNPRAEQVDSALCEVGNILVSHVVSAMADTLGTRVLPSTPQLEHEDVERALAERARRAGVGELWIEAALHADGGGLDALVVFAPDPTCARQPAARSDTVGA